MSRYKCDACRNLKSTELKTYTAQDGKHVEEYAVCKARWTLPKVHNGDFCFDFKARRGE